MTVSTTTDDLILQALENPEYVWRTVSGLKKETNLPRNQIVTTLNRLPKDKLLVSRSAQGQRLYSTRKHYRERQSIAAKLLSVFAGRVL